MRMQTPSPYEQTLGEHLRSQGISRRSFLKFCGLLASSMALGSGDDSENRCSAWNRQNALR